MGARAAVVADVVFKAGASRHIGRVLWKAGEKVQEVTSVKVIRCLNMNTVQYQYDATTQKSLTLNQAVHWEERLSAAQRRYQRAPEILAKIRRMKLPAVQVNIGENQINVA
jgi:hypothetical protein